MVGIERSGPTGHPPGSHDTGQCGHPARDTTPRHRVSEVVGLHAPIVGRQEQPWRPTASAFRRYVTGRS